jgi:hypothetical protein
MGLSICRRLPSNVFILAFYLKIPETMYGRVKIFMKNAHGGIKKKRLNIVLWVLQVLLALYNLAGGYYTLHNYGILVSPVYFLFPKEVWMLLGILQMLLALCLLTPGKNNKFPRLISIAAAALAVDMMVLGVMTKYSDGFSGILWALIPSIFAAFVAYHRWPRNKNKT